MSPLLASLAFAFPADAPAECAVATLSDSIPGNGATDVPIDIAPLLVFRGSCGVAAPYRLAVFEAGVIDPVHTEDYDFPAFQAHGEHWVLEADFGELAAETTYTVELSAEWGERVQFGFSTGSELADAIPGGVPALAIERASQVEVGGGQFRTAVEIELTSAGRGQGAYVIREGGSDRAVVLASGDRQIVSVEWGDFERAREVCLTAIERDGIGNWHGPSDEVCASLETARGCAHTPPGLSGWMGLAQLALGRRR